ncbi:Swt1 family HEPN domain-containing protein [Methylocystis heyeri]|uniref:Uncharacterized protein n=1 Tax=Methylocystis heyeri TaxID=391905 RepID=A0A6B8KB68_9HYPH|nr:Swt1 family HEPN domain-containing protein [Methylocystis heyeri]QGM45614.1 hypothetical protein H2LOC_007820 [Methylocystis heyeri]
MSDDVIPKIGSPLDGSDSLRLINKSAINPLLGSMNSTHLNEIERLSALVKQFSPPVMPELEGLTKMADIASAHLKEMDRLSAFAKQFQAPVIPEVERFANISNLASAHLKEMERLSTSAKQFGTYICPEVEALSKYSRAASLAIAPFSAETGRSLWESRIAGKLGAFNRPWALEGALGISVTGFARLARISDAAHYSQPFDEPVAELFREELGFGIEADESADAEARDAAAVEAGLHPGLIAFPREEYGDVICAAGFQFEFAVAPLPVAIEDGDPGAVLDPRHNEVLTNLELSLRYAIEAKLSALDGDAWVKRRVPPKLRDEWQALQAKDRQDGRSVYGLIHYADFSHLESIIAQKNNWSDAFGAIFGNKEFFCLALRQLCQIRNAVSHRRPLGRADVLMLFAQSTRIYKALGLKVFR